MTEHSTNREGMDADCQEALELSREKLVKELNVLPAADYLRSKMVLTAEDYQKITTYKTEHDQRRKLLDILPQRGQRAFDEFCTFLGEEESQPWLRKELESNANLSPQKIKQKLVHKLHEYVQNDPSQILEGSNKNAYVEQPINFLAEEESSQEDETTKRAIRFPAEAEADPKDETTASILKLLQNATPGERFFVLGAAGMGKSALCRWIAENSAEQDNGLYERYEYVFTISLSTVQSSSMKDIICKDNGLISESCMDKVQLEPGKAMFILDSYEEMSKKTREIDELITGRIFGESTVIVTSRPTAEIKILAEKATSCRIAQLQYFTEEQARNYIRSNLNEEACSRTEQLLGVSFLQRPINLWLVCCFMAQQSNGTKLPGTQTVLVNRIVMHIMLAYAKKRKLLEFTIPEPPSMENNEPTEVRSILIVLGRLCYKALRHGSYTLQINEGPFSLEEIMNIGLFIEGPEKNSVTLPHRIFQEYLAAVYLAYDSYARQALIQELGLTKGARAGTDNPSLKELLSLEELLKPLELSGVITFLVGLLPGFVRGLQKFFVIKQRRVVREIQPELQYELALLHECPDKGVKSDIAKALLRAPVLRDAPEMLTDDYTMNPWAYEMLEHLTEDESLIFLESTYGLRRRDTYGQKTLLADREEQFVLDSLAVGFIHRFNYTLRAEDLFIVDSHMAGQLMHQSLGNVASLYLEGCTLCKKMPRVYGIRGNLGKVPRAQSLLERLYLTRVRRLHYLSEMRPARVLSITQSSEGCELESLGGKAERLYFTDTRLMYSFQSKMTSVTELNIWRCLSVKLCKIAQMLTHLKQIVIRHSVTAVEAILEWKSVEHLEMDYCSLKTAENPLMNEQQAENCLKQMCPQAFIKIEHYKGPMESGTECVALFDNEGQEKGNSDFRKGDRFQFVHLDGTNRALAINRAGKKVTIPLNCFSKREPVHLEKITWLHADVERTEIINRFLLHREANYLVVQTLNEENKYYTLWIHRGNRYFDYAIKTKDKLLTIDGKRCFRSLHRLVEYYQTHTDVDCLGVRLLKGVPTDSNVYFFVDEKSFERQGWTINTEKLQLEMVCVDREKSECIFTGRNNQDVFTLRQINSVRNRDKTLVEAAVMTRLRHPNVVSFKGVTLGNTVEIVTEHMASGSLRDYIVKADRSVREERQLHEFARQICSAMAYLEQERLVHRCLTAQDVWIHEDGTAKPFNYKSDVWSYGVVLWEIYSNGAWPYRAVEGEASIIWHLANGVRLDLPDGSPNVMRDIMQKAWAWDPKERPTFREILEQLDKR